MRCSQRKLFKEITKTTATRGHSECLLTVLITAPRFAQRLPSKIYIYIYICEEAHNQLKQKKIISGAYPLSSSRGERVFYL